MKQRLQQRRVTYMIPFFLLILIGIAVSMLIKFYTAFWGNQQFRLVKHVILYTDSANADLLSWQSSRWNQIPSGSYILEGDTIKTKINSKSLLSIYDKNFLRIDGVSTLQFDSVIDPNFNITLENGRYWVDWRYDSQQNAVLETNTTIVEATNALFDIKVAEKFFEIQMLEGTASLKIVDRSENRVRLLDRFDLKQGFKAVIGEVEMNLLRQSMAIDVMYPIADNYEQDAWYVWNSQQNLDPLALTQIDTYRAANFKRHFSSETAPELQRGNIFEEKMMLRIESPENGALISDSKLLLSGIVLPGADYIEVVSINDRGSDSYRLNKFEPGDLEFSYSADFRYENLARGENIFRVIATSLKLRQSVMREIRVIVE